MKIKAVVDVMGPNTAMLIGAAISGGAVKPLAEILAAKEKAVLLERVTRVARR